jgi:hypothetical protein
MSTGRSIHSDSTRSCRRFCVVALAALFACLCTASNSEAKPQIYIMFCGQAGGGQAPFYLYWGSEGTRNASNYIWTYLYDINGNVISGYPAEDYTDYVIPTTQIGSPASCNGTNQTGTEPDIATNAVTVSLNVSGDWNGASTGTEACGTQGQYCGLIKPATSGGATGSPVIVVPQDVVNASLNTAFPFSGNNVISVNDPNGAASPEQMTLTVNHGTLTGINQVAGLTVSGNGTLASPLILTATSATILTNNLPGLIYTPTPATYTGPDTLGILDKDTSDNLSAQPTTVSIIVNPLGPAITAPPAVSIPVTASTAPNTTIPFSGSNAISIADSSNGGSGNSQAFTLSVANGTLSVGTLAGVTVSGVGTPAFPLALAGTAANVTQLLPSLVYTPAPSHLTGYDTLTLNDTDTTNGLKAPQVTVPITIAMQVSNPTAPGSTVKPTLKVKLQGKRLSHGETSKYDVWIEVTNPNTTTDAKKVRFVYALFAKTDPDNGDIIPIKQQDFQGNQRMFSVVPRGGAHGDTNKTDSSRSDLFDYTIPKNTPADQPFLVKDLKVDLSKGVAPGDAVYMDVWVIDQANHEHYYLERKQLLP